jgi:chemotaxis protein MotA
VERRLDLSTLFGVIGALVLIVLAIAVGSKASFFDFSAVLIVVGGTLAVTTACYSIPEMANAQSVIFKTIFHSIEDPTQASLLLLTQAEEARRGSILSLQKSIKETDGNEFFRKGINMVIDGADPDVVERILKQDISSMVDRHTRGASILRKGAEIAPAMGLICTLIGLVQMLGNLSDPSSIGPAMAVALLGTLYGAVLAYVVLSPLASKLERNSREEVLINTLYLKGTVSIGRKENPRHTEMLLNTILPPAMRIKYFE